MKKQIATLTSIAFFILSSNALVFSESATAPKWDSAVLECMQAYIKKPQDSSKMWSIKNPFKSKENLICEWVDSSPQSALYQAVLDAEFSEVDVDVEKFLTVAFKWTSLPMDAINDLQAKLWINWEEWSFARRYNDICRFKIKNDSSAFLERHKEELKINALTTWVGTSDTMFWYKCTSLYYNKLQAYYDAWTVIIKRENVNNFDFSKKTYMTKIKDKYRKLLFKLTTYLWQLKVINWKWYINTKSPMN